MQVESSDRLRNVAVVGHNDTGKTTLVSALLYTSGQAKRLHRISDGNTVTDFDPQEVERGHSIGLGVCSLGWRNHKLNLIDCPGAGIFQSEARAGVRAADLALVCVNAAAGIQVSTEKVQRFARQLGAPTAFLITKCDRENTDLAETTSALQERYGRGVIALQVPIGGEADFLGVVDLVSGQAWSFDREGNGKGSKIEVPAELADEVAEARSNLVEAVAESDEELMETFFEEGDLNEEQLRSGLRRAVATRELLPVLFCAAEHGIGSAPVLDHLVDVAPSPMDRASFPLVDGGEPVGAKGDGGPLALVFKTLNDPFSGKISIFRVVRGTFAGDQLLANSTQGAEERAGHALRVQGKDNESVESIVAGDIGAIAKLKVTQTGDTLTSKGGGEVIEWITMAAPAIAFAIEPKAKGDEEKIGEACQKLVEEDPSLQAGRDPQTGEFLLSGSGQLHVEIAVAKLKNRFKVEVILHPPKVPYRETIRKAAEGHGRHKKQSGGRGQFADCKIAIEPLERGGGFEFKDEIFGGSIPQGYRPAVEKGVLETAERGVLAGHPVVDFRVRLLDGQYHDVDSSEMAFKVAGSLGFKEAVAKAGAVILEPVMAVEINTTEDFMGDVMSDLAQRRGKPQGMEAGRRGSQLVKALVPMAEMLNYETALRSMTQGRSSFAMEFSHYEEVPRQVQAKLVAEAQQDQGDE